MGTLHTGSLQSSRLQSTAHTPHLSNPWAASRGAAHQSQHLHHQQHHRASGVASCSYQAPQPINAPQHAPRKRLHSQPRSRCLAAVSTQEEEAPAAEETTSLASLGVGDDLKASKALAAIIAYAIEFARTSQTYEVNSWMLLLGILKQEQCTAAKTLKAMGLDDLYGAWHEVLWALNVVDALEPRPATAEIGFADRAYHVLVGATNFAGWGGRTKVQSEDLLMALAAGMVLEGLFPDINPSFPRVRVAVEKQAGGVYVLPDDDEEGDAVRRELKEEDSVF